MHDSLCRWCIVKKKKKLKLCETFLDFYASKILWNLDWSMETIIYVNRENKTKLMVPSFSCYLEFSWEK